MGVPDSADEDEALMLRAAKGDRAAFARLFDRHQRRVVRFCYRYTGELPRAEELAQDVFVRLYRAAPRYEARARFTAFLFHIAANVCLNARRGPARQREAPQGDDAEAALERAPDAVTPEAALEAKDAEAAVTQALAAMSERERAAFAMARFEGLPYRDIATALGASEAAVKSLIHRASLQVLARLEALSAGAPARSST
jgi:RNA polymerase sigma-70 factor (ECF subfamily)